MALFSKVYYRVIKWAGHSKASYFLGGVSIAESAVLPFPPDILLAPMVLAKPASAWRYALLATVGSVIGAMLGYLIGFFAYDFIVEPLVNYFDYVDQYQAVVRAFDAYGIWIILGVAFVPLPFKLFTIAAGVVEMSFFPFVIAALIGRGLRFTLVAALARYGGDVIEKRLIKFLDKIEWILLLLLVGSIVIYQVI